MLEKEKREKEKPKRYFRGTVTIRAKDLFVDNRADLLMYQVKTLLLSITIRNVLPPPHNGEY